MSQPCESVESELVYLANPCRVHDSCDAYQLNKISNTAFHQNNPQRFWRCSFSDQLWKRGREFYNHHLEVPPQSAIHRYNGRRVFVRPLDFRYLASACCLLSAS